MNFYDTIVDSNFNANQFYFQISTVKPLYVLASSVANSIPEHR